MAIVQNRPCPACQETGHDKTGNHLMVFDDGNMLCNRIHFHKDGEPYFIKSGEDDPIVNMEVSGKIKYTPDQFETLIKEGKLDSPAMRWLALSGMKGQDRWDCANEQERQLMTESRDYELAYFNNLKFRNLVTRHIRGDIAKFYNIRTGLDENGKTVDRHYYPVYSRITGELQGAKCRTLPKDFTKGTLGWTWGDTMLAGQQTLNQVLEEGGRIDTLLICGGECDMAAGQQMIYDSRKGTKYEGIHAHVWSPTKGEKCYEEILSNKDSINKFKKVILAFDNDDTGNKLTSKVAMLFRDKSYKLPISADCKDVNDMLKKGKEKEFIDGWFNPISPFEGGNIRSMKHYRDKAVEKIEPGLSFPWPDLDKTVYAQRLNQLLVWGAGTGVGKTSITKEIVFNLVMNHGKRVMVIFLENQAYKVVRSFAGFLINKDLSAPAIHDKNDPDYEEVRDYTEEEATAAIDALCEIDKIMIGDLEGRKDVDSVMELIEQGIALGYEYFAIDNLTAFEHRSKDGKIATKVNAIDETMKRLGTAKDENAIHIMLLSHLNRNTDIPFEEGGEVGLHNFMGASSITFWADGVFSAERDTKHPNINQKCITTLRCCKSRDAGHNTGFTTNIKKDLKTGRLLPTKEVREDRHKKEKKDSKPKRENFDTGEY